MGVVGEFLIIASAGAAGVLFAAIPGFPLPGTVTGMLIMLVLLLSGLIKLKWISSAANFFLKFLPLFFIPLIVNLLREADILNTWGFKLVIIIVLTTVITMAATGLTAKLMLAVLHRRSPKGGKGV